MTFCEPSDDIAVEDAEAEETPVGAEVVEATVVEVAVAVDEDAFVEDALTVMYLLEATFHDAQVPACEGKTSNLATPPSQQLAARSQQKEVSVLVTLEHDIKSCPPVTAPRGSKRSAEGGERHGGFVATGHTAKKEKAYLGSTSHIQATPNSCPCMPLGPDFHLSSGKACWRGRHCPGHHRNMRSALRPDRRGSCQKRCFRWGSSRYWLQNIASRK